jgi:hypothetical protein
MQESALKAPPGDFHSSGCQKLKTLLGKDEENFSSLFKFSGCDRRKVFYIARDNC